MFERWSFFATSLVVGLLVVALHLRESVGKDRTWPHIALQPYVIGLQA